MSLFAECPECHQDTAFYEREGSASCSECGAVLADYVQIDKKAEFRSFEDGPDRDHYGYSTTAGEDEDLSAATSISLAGDFGSSASSQMGKKLRYAQKRANYSYKEERDREQIDLLSEICDQMSVGRSCKTWAEELYTEIVTAHRERLHKSTALLVACIWEASFLCGLNVEDGVTQPTMGEDYFMKFITDDKGGRTQAEMLKHWRDKVQLVREAVRTLLLDKGRDKIDDLCRRLNLGDRTVDCERAAVRIFEEMCAQYTNPRLIKSSPLYVACVYVASFVCGVNKVADESQKALVIPADTFFRFVDDEGGAPREQLFAHWLAKVNEAQAAWNRCLARMQQSAATSPQPPASMSSPVDQTSRISPPPAAPMARPQPQQTQLTPQQQQLQMLLQQRNPALLMMLQQQQQQQQQMQSIGVKRERDDSQRDDPAQKRQALPQYPQGAFPTLAARSNGM